MGLLFLGWDSYSLGVMISLNVSSDKNFVGCCQKQRPKDFTPIAFSCYSNWIMGSWSYHSMRNLPMFCIHWRPVSKTAEKKLFLCQTAEKKLLFPRWQSFSNGYRTWAGPSWNDNSNCPWIESLLLYIAMFYYTKWVVTLIFHQWLYEFYRDKCVGLFLPLSIFVIEFY